MTYVFNPMKDFVRTASDMEKEMRCMFTDQCEETVDAFFTPAADIHETESAYRVEIDLPGMTREDIKLSLESNVLTIKGQRKSNITSGEKMYRHCERASGTFQRSFNLSRLINSNAIEAKYENGVLSLTLPKIEEAKPKDIEIKIS